MDACIVTSGTGNAFPKDIGNSQGSASAAHCLTSSLCRVFFAPPRRKIPYTEKEIRGLRTFGIGCIEIHCIHTWRAR
jgi:hypothetical protein